MRVSLHRGFTLIELLVVISIIGLLVGLLLPALATARRNSLNTISLANLRSLGQIQAYYANEQRDCFVNPFVSSVTPGTPWHGILVPGPFYRGYWDMGLSDNARRTEAFGFHWASLVGEYIQEGLLDLKVQFSPLDTTVLQRFQRTVANAPSTAIYIWDGSYWASPTLWLNPSRYQTQFLTTVNQFTLRRNRFDDVIFPQAKVMVFERFDLSQRSRSGNQGAVDLPPQWNHPQAKARFVLVDGSVDQVATRQLLALTTSSNQAVRDAFIPSGPFAPSAGMMQTYDMHQDGLEYGGATGGTYPAFFWATRKGVQGRDINR